MFVSFGMKIAMLNMSLTRTSTAFLLRGLFLFGLGCQHGSSQVHKRSFCTGITMLEIRLCDNNLPIIEIVEVSQYDFTGDEYPGRPCVYSDRDCGRAIRHSTQLYRDILTHCDGQRTCGGFYITFEAVCSGRFGDYMVISFRCHRDETATMRGTSSITQEAKNAPPTSPSTPIATSAKANRSPTNPPNTTYTSATTTGSPVNPPTSSGVIDGESNETETVANTFEVPQSNNIELYAGVAVGGVTAVILVIVVIAVCVKRKRNNQKPIRASPPLGTEGISGSESGAASPRKSGQRLDKANLREGGGTEARRANDEVAYYNMAPYVIPGEAAYCNVDINKAPGRAIYSDVDIRMEPERKTSSDMVPYANIQHATHTNLASVGAGNDTYSNLEQNTPGVPANVPGTDGQYAGLTGEGPGSSEYEALGPELVVHSSEYVALNNRQ